MTLPPLPTVYATSMLLSQGWKPSKEERSAIKVRQEFLRSEGLPSIVNIKVKHYNGHELLGWIEFAAKGDV